MYAPRVFIGMLGALVVFTAVTYGLNGSLRTTLIQTAVCALLLQIGYFGGVLFMAWKESRKRKAEAQTTPAPPQSGSDGAEKIPVSTFDSSEPSNPD